MTGCRNFKAPPSHRVCRVLQARGTISTPDSSSTNIVRGPFGHFSLANTVLNFFHTANDRETKQGPSHMGHLLLQLVNLPSTVH